MDQPAIETPQPQSQPRREAWLTAAGLWNAFKTFAIVFSFVTNLVLVIVLVLLITQLPKIYAPAKAGMLDPIVGGLYEGFGGLNDAKIVRTIEVHDTVPAVFNLPLDQYTTVKLTEPVTLTRPATYSLGPFGEIRGTVEMMLPPGMELPIHLKMNVPVSQTIPVDLKVAVNIPLSETELGPRFVEFQKLFAPLNEIAHGLPDDWNGLVVCVEGGQVPPNCK